jgi:hypothetical protein
MTGAHLGCAQTDARVMRSSVSHRTAPPAAPQAKGRELGDPAPPIAPLVASIGIASSQRSRLDRPSQPAKRRTSSSPRTATNLTRPRIAASYRKHALDIGPPKTRRPDPDPRIRPCRARSDHRTRTSECATSAEATTPRCHRLKPRQPRAEPRARAVEPRADPTNTVTPIPTSQERVKHRRSQTPPAPSPQRRQRGQAPRPVPTLENSAQPRATSLARQPRHASRIDLRLRADPASRGRSSAARQRLPSAIARDPHPPKPRSAPRVAPTHSDQRASPPRQGASRCPSHPPAAPADSFREYPNRDADVERNPRSAPTSPGNRPHTLGRAITRPQLPGYCAHPRPVRRPCHVAKRRPPSACRRSRR